MDIDKNAPINMVPQLTLKHTTSTNKKKRKQKRNFYQLQVRIIRNGTLTDLLISIHHINGHRQKCSNKYGATINTQAHYVNK